MISTTFHLISLLGEINMDVNTYVSNKISGFVTISKEDKEILYHYASTTYNKAGIDMIIQRLKEEGGQFSEPTITSISQAIQACTSEQAYKNRIRDFTNDPDEMQTLVKELKKGVNDLISSNRYQKYLDLQSKFYQYSLYNTLLIAFQNPEATYVGSFTFWRHQGRYVKSGEKGIRILAPSIGKRYVDVPKKDADGNIIKRKDGSTEIESIAKDVIIGYHWTTTFDVSQTDGRPLPQILDKLEGSDAIARKIIEIITSLYPNRIFYDALTGPNGYYDPKTGDIHIKDTLSDNHTAKTILHEYAHHILHNDIQNYKENRYACEIEAESTAYIISKHYGLDTSMYSFGYIATWTAGQDLDSFEKSMKQVCSTAQQIINQIDNVLQLEYEHSLLPKKELLLKTLPMFGIKPTTKLVSLLSEMSNASLEKLFSSTSVGDGQSPPNAKTALRYLDSQKKKLPARDCDILQNAIHFISNQLRQHDIEH